MLDQDEPTLLRWLIARPARALAARAAVDQGMVKAATLLGALCGLAALAFAFVWPNVQACAAAAILALILDGIGRGGLEPESGSAGWSFLVAMAPLRTALALVGLALTVPLDGVALVLLPCLVMILFFDPSAFRVALKIRGSYRGLYAPTPKAADAALTAMVDRFRATGLSPIVIGHDEIAVAAFLLLVLAGGSIWGLGGLIVVATVALYWRLSLDAALIRRRAAA